MSKKAEIKAILSDGQWHSGNEFLSKYIPTYAQRISEMNRELEERDHPARIVSRRTKTVNEYKVARFEDTHRVANGGGYSYEELT